MLREAADDFIDMCDTPQNFLLGYRGAGRFIPSFPGGRKSAPEPLDEVIASEEEEGSNDEGVDPAISMSGEPEK